VGVRTNYRKETVYLYRLNSIDELRRRSQINEAARAADDAPDFSERIRTSLPTITR
jgi:hypothetical protein